MAKLSAHRVLVAGLLSPPAAAFLGIRVYSALTRASADPDRDFVFRLTTTTLAMVLPFLVTAGLAVLDRRRQAWTISAKIGLALSVLSLSLAWLPLQGLLGRARQARSLAQRGVVAPAFDTVDIHGQRQRLADHAGKVVVVNAWATWCGPCRREMPDLDRLYRARQDQGLMVFGLSTEEVEAQRTFAEEKVKVTYPLLTIRGDVPEMYRVIERYPATFLIDRAGRLQPAPGPDEPFARMEAAVDALIRADGPAKR